MFFIRKKNRAAKYLFIGFIVFYGLFVIASFINYRATLDNAQKVQKQVDKLEEVNLNTNRTEGQVVEGKPVAEVKAEGNKAITIEKEAVITGKLAQKIMISITVTNNMGKDMEMFKMTFEKPGFSNLLTINAVDPKAQIIKNTFSFGKLAAGGKQTYSIETYPVRSGTYESAISFKNGDQTIKDTAGNDIKDLLKVVVNP